MINEVSADAAPDPIAEHEIAEFTAIVISRIDQTLDEREQFIVRGRFGLNGTGESKTFSRLGEVARPFESTLAPM